MSDKNFQRLVHGEIKEVQLNTVVSICIAMNLPPEISFLLVQSAGLGFKDTAEHTMLKSILYSLSPVNIIGELKKDYDTQYGDLPWEISKSLETKFEEIDQVE